MYKRQVSNLAILSIENDTASSLDEGLVLGLVVNSRSRFEKNDLGETVDAVVHFNNLAVLAVTHAMTYKLDYDNTTKHYRRFCFITFEVFSV